MHITGEETPKMVHPAIRSCVPYYINILKSWEKHAHTGCTGFKTHAPGSQNVHTGCRVLISNTAFPLTYCIHISHISSLYLHIQITNCIALVDRGGGGYLDVFNFD